LQWEGFDQSIGEGARFQAIKPNPSLSQNRTWAGWS
jgi:hypothetical protein